MRIQKVDPELYFEIRSAWMLEEKQRDDSARTLDQMEHNLLQDPGTFWYFGPGKKNFFWVSDVVPGERAQFHSINADGREGFDNRKAAMKLIRDIMSDLDVHRLEAFVPAPAQVHKSLMWHLGFTHEGRLRGRLRYDGTWTDAEVYGLLAEELDKKIKRRKRTHRKGGGETKGVVEAEGGGTEETS